MSLVVYMTQIYYPPQTVLKVAFIDVPSGNRSILSSFPHDDIVSAMTEQAIAPKNLWFFIISFC